MDIKKIFLMGCLASASLSAFADHAKVQLPKSYLDPAVYNVTMDGERCFRAAPKCLLEVNFTAGRSTYQVSQECDIEKEKILYSENIEPDLPEIFLKHKVAAQALCHGTTTLSDMDVAFPKGKGIQDANDGFLLTEAERHGLANVLNQLQEMTDLALRASSGTYSSSQLEFLNTEFQAHLIEIGRIATYTRFNGISLLDGSIASVDVPIHHGKDHMSLPMTNLSQGLNIRALDLVTQSDSEAAFDSVNSAIDVVDASLKELMATQVKLREIADEDATVVSWNLTNGKLN